jgi:hypothetical protein
LETAKHDIADASHALEVIIQKSESAVPKGE